MQGQKGGPFSGMLPRGQGMQEAFHNDRCAGAALEGLADCQGVVTKHSYVFENQVCDNLL